MRKKNPQKLTRVESLAEAGDVGGQTRDAVDTDDVEAAAFDLADTARHQVGHGPLLALAHVFDGHAEDARRRTELHRSARRVVVGEVAQRHHHRQLLGAGHPGRRR